MPYKIRKHGKCFSVVNTKTGAVKSKCTSKAKASRQLRLLNAIDHGWSSTKSKGRRLKRSKSGARKCIKRSKVRSKARSKRRCLKWSKSGARRCVKRSRK